MHTNETHLPLQHRDLIVPKDKSYYINLNHHLSYFEIMDEETSTPFQPKKKASCFCF